MRTSPLTEHPRHSIAVVPIELAKQHGDDAGGRQLAALDQNLQGAIVESFRRMIRNLHVVRVGTAFQQQASQLRMMSNAGGTIEYALPLRCGFMALVIK